MRAVKGVDSAWRWIGLLAFVLWATAVPSALLAAEPQTAPSVVAVAAQAQPSSAQVEASLGEGPLAGRSADYRTFFGGNSRLIMWIITQLHLMFGAFVLGAPIFASIAEIARWRNGGSSDGSADPSVVHS
ncbi:MAG: hypothetical protein ACE5IQ_14160 [Candidatus Methylomirabilales bacterium]